MIIDTFFEWFIAHLRPISATSATCAMVSICHFPLAHLGVVIPWPVYAVAGVENALFVLAWLVLFVIVAPEIAREIRVNLRSRRQAQ